MCCDDGVPGKRPLLSAPKVALLYRFLAHLHVRKHQASGGECGAGDQQSLGRGGLVEATCYVGKRFPKVAQESGCVRMRTPREFHRGSR